MKKYYTAFKKIKIKTQFFELLLQNVCTLCYFYINFFVFLCFLLDSHTT